MRLQRRGTRGSVCIKRATYDWYCGDDCNPWNDDVVKCRRFPHRWPHMKEMLSKMHQCRVLIFPSLFAWTSCWTNNRMWCETRWRSWQTCPQTLVAVCRYMGLCSVWGPWSLLIYRGFSYSAKDNVSTRIKFQLFLLKNKTKNARTNTWYDISMA